jgi:hypothetical protein
MDSPFAASIKYATLSTEFPRYAAVSTILPLGCAVDMDNMITLSHKVLHNKVQFQGKLCNASETRQTFQKSCLRLDGWRQLGWSYTSFRLRCCDSKCAIKFSFMYEIKSFEYSAFVPDAIPDT